MLAALSLDHGERVLTAATSRDGSWYVGTTLAIHLPEGPADARAYRRLPWEQIGSADWERESERLAIVELGSTGDPERATVIEVDEPGRLLELVHERVTKSLVWTAYAVVRGRTGVTVVARRSPSGTGPVRWTTLAPGLDPHDPAVRRVVEGLLRQGTAELADLE